MNELDAFILGKQVLVRWMNRKCGHTWVAFKPKSRWDCPKCRERVQRILDAGERNGD